MFFLNQYNIDNIQLYVFMYFENIKPLLFNNYAFLVIICFNIEINELALKRKNYFVMHVVTKYIVTIVLLK